jgi:hypothetical protein
MRGEEEKVYNTDGYGFTENTSLFLITFRDEEKSFIILTDGARR